MPLSPGERKLLELVERRGVPVDWGSENRKFKLAVSPIVSAGVDVAALVSLTEETNNELNRQNAEFELKGIVLFPIVADPSIFRRNDFLTHKRVSGGYFVGRNISFECWCAANAQVKLGYAHANFCDSILAIPDRQLSTSSKVLLLAALGTAAANVLGAMNAT